MEYIIRRRTKDDCLSIAHVVTVGWNETYKGIVPDWFLEELKTNEKERADRMINNFDENNNHQLVLEINNEIEIIEHLKNIILTGKEILQTPGGPRDIVLFTINVVSFYYHALLFIQTRYEDDKKYAKIQLSIIETYEVMDKFLFYEKATEIYKKLKDIQFEECITIFRTMAKKLASFETNQLKLLFR